MVKNYHDYLFYDENKQIRHFISINAMDNLMATLKICFLFVLSSSEQISKI